MRKPPVHESVVDVPEGELIRRVLADPHWHGRFLRIYGIPDGARFFPEVPLSKLGAKGDIDILAANPDAPQNATAIQVKRIKVSPKTFQTGKPNKLAAITELHRKRAVNPS